MDWQPFESLNYVVPRLLSRVAVCMCVMLLGAEIARSERVDFSQLQTVDTSRTAMRLVELPFAGIVKFVDRQGRSVSIDRRSLVRFGRDENVASTSGVLLVDGSWLSGRIESVSRDAVAINGRYFRTKVSLNDVRAIGFHLPRGVYGRHAYFEFFKAAKGEKDLLITVNGDQLGGVLQLPTDQQFAKVRDSINWKLRIAEGVRETSHLKTRALVFSPLLHPMVKPQDRAMSVLMDDGSRLNVHSFSLEESKVLLELSGGLRVRATVGSDLFTSGISRLEGTPQRSVFAAELTPVGYKQASTFGSEKWPIGKNSGLHEYERSLRVSASKSKDPISVKPIKVGAATFTRGVVLHANSQLAYRIPDGAVSFHARLGVASENPSASVIFRVVTISGAGKTKPLFSSSAIGVGDSAPDDFHAVNVRLEGARILLLVVEDAGDGDAGDHGAWLDARFAISESS